MDSATALFTYNLLIYMQFLPRDPSELKTELNRRTEDRLPERPEPQFTLPSAGGAQPRSRVRGGRSFFLWPEAAEWTGRRHGCP